MKKILFFLLLTVSSLSGFGQSLDWPRERAVYQRDVNGNANIWFTGTCTSCNSGDIEVVINNNVENKLDFVSGSNKFKFRLNKSTGWYTTRVTVNGNISLNNKKVGVGDVYIVSGQSNVEGKFDTSNDVIGANSDMVNCVGNLFIKSSQPLSSTFPSNVTYLNDADPNQNVSANSLSTFQNVSFAQLGTNVIVGPRGRGGWLWGKLGDLIASNKSIPTLFINAAYEGTSIVAWKKSKDSPNGSIQHPDLSGPYPTGMPFSILKNSILAYANILGLRAIIWHQGEADNSRTTYKNDSQGNTSSFNSSTYNTFLNEIITETQNLSKNTALPNGVTWIVNSTSYNSDVSISDNTVVKPGQAAVLNDSRSIIFGIDTDWLYSGCRRDNVHFDVATLDKVAQGFYQMLYETNYSNLPKCDNSTYGGTNPTYSKIQNNLKSPTEPPSPISVPICNSCPTAPNTQSGGNASESYTYTACASTAGTYNIKLTYASGEPSPTGRISIDNGGFTQFSLPGSTGSWTPSTASPTILTVSLSQGNHTITITGVNGISGSTFAHNKVCLEATTGGGCDFNLSASVNNSNPPCNTSITLTGVCSGANCGSGVNYSWSGGVASPTSLTTQATASSSVTSYTLNGSKSGCPNKSATVSVNCGSSCNPCATAPSTQSAGNASESYTYTACASTPGCFNVKLFYASGEPSPTGRISIDNGGFTQFSLPGSTGSWTPSANSSVAIKLASLSQGNHTITITGVNGISGATFAHNKVCLETYNSPCRVSAELTNNQNEVEMTKLIAYPNPTSDKVNVAFSLENDTNVWLNLYDTQGKSLDLRDFEGKTGSNVVEYDLKNYPTGTYFVNLQNGGRREVVKVIKIK